MIGLAGKRVPVNLAVVPATIVAILVTSSGVMYIRLAFGTGIEGKWVTNMPETLWPLWGLGLFVAALAYRQRRLTTEKTAE
jgi:energy-coupling factor transporter transmembrane protein EcfT